MNETLTQRDKKYLWHPYIQHGIDQESLPVISAKGSVLTLEDGTEIIDAISSWWVNLHGHAHPTIAQAIFQQAQKLEQVIFAGFTHEPATALAEKLITAAQEKEMHLSRCFFSDNGSTAVEIAMKMAYQYHHNNGDYHRRKFIALTHSYHGDTLGCMSLSARNSFHVPFQKLFFEVSFISPNDLTSLEAVLSNAHEYAAIIVEPMVQGAGGMRLYSADFLQKLAHRCQTENVLLICDEVFTGFYRTGKLFASEHANIKPDLLCLGKGLTGGFLPLAATLATEKIFNSFIDQTNHKTFLHGHSFTANPLGCAAALASWDLLHQTDTQNNMQRIAHQTSEWIQYLSRHPDTLNARHLGCIGAIEHKYSTNYLINQKIRSHALSKGVLLRPLGSVIYAVPPYCITNTELDQVYSTIESILAHLGDFQ